MSLHLQRDLDKLKKEILKLGNMVEVSINNAILALNNREKTYVHEVFANEELINEMEVKVEEDCLKILALHQPVAVDLRFLVVVLKVNNDLERMGDIAKNIAKRASELMEADPIPELNLVIQGLPEMIKTMVRNSLDALIKLDDQLAREIIDMDDKVDDINKEMYLAIKKAVRENPGLTDVAINLLATSRYMERIGDLSTNIAEDVIFMVEGKVIRHAE
ncbi:MAG: phosphate transport system regulatory protein PhoU [Gammaproteobacteria bacterium]|nr:phosphate transport system regulatory protein PhoU [Gammaproteobacteria bacterium]